MYIEKVCSKEQAFVCYNLDECTGNGLHEFVDLADGFVVFSCYKNFCYEV